MMSILLALFFFGAAALEGAVVHSLPMPYTTFPLMFLCGILIIQRLDLGLGVVWIMLAGLLAHPWGEGNLAVFPYFMAALAGIPLVTKVFTNRSLYALIGLGMVLHLVAVSSALLQGLAVALVTHKSLFAFGFSRFRLSEAVFLFIGLAIGGILTRKLHRWSQRTFFLHS